MGRKKKKFVINDKTYYGYEELSKEFGLSVVILQNRISSGWTLEEAVGLKKRDLNTKRKFVIRGETFYGYDALVERFNIPRTTLNPRLQHGWTIEEAVGLVPHVYGKLNEYIIDGEVFYGYKELEDRFKVSHIKIANRIRLGWSLEEAVEIKKYIPKKITKFIVSGEVFYGYKELEDRFKVKCTTVMGRIKNGWTLEESVELVPPFSKIDCRRPKTMSIIFGNIKIINKAYDSSNESYYECKENGENIIYSSTHLVQLWKEWKTNNTKIK